jgi:hypothetical protein
VASDAEKEAVALFGKFLMENFRDRGIECFDRLASGKYHAPKLQKLQQDLHGLGAAGLAVARRALVNCLDNSIHDLLFKLQEQADFENDVRVMVRGVNVVEASDGIHGEAFGKDGWQARFSKYGEAREEA